MSLHAFRLLIFIPISFFLCSIDYTQTPLAGKSVYDQIKAFNLTGGKADLSNFVLKRDRVVLILNGTVYFSAPIGGAVTGAVFVGHGTFFASTPPSEFEKTQLKRLLQAESVESDFSSAVFRFSDDTFDLFRNNFSDGSGTPEAQKLATEFENRTLRQTGANVASRITESLLNQENPGVFFGTFEGGRRGQFSYALDYQNRLPSDCFGLNAGERGLIFKYQADVNNNDIWMAFYSLSDYARGSASYSDLYDLVDITNYDMKIDLREPKKKLGLQARISLKSKITNLKAVTFKIGENLGEDEKERLKKQMRLKSVRLGSVPLESIQEDWESGFTVFLPNAVGEGQAIDLDVELEGDFLRQPNSIGGSALS
ncbi:MAG: hypothetical protein ABI999_18080 [Acidobacteriota bacterium]